MLVISNRPHASVSSDFQINRAIAPSRMDCGFCSVNRVDWRILKTQWIVDQLKFLTRISDCAWLMFGSWVLNKICIMDLSLALVGMLMSSSKLFLFLKGIHLNSSVALFLELYSVIVIKHVAFFTFGRN